LGVCFKVDALHSSEKVIFAKIFENYKLLYDYFN